MSSAFRTVALQVAGTVAAFLILERYLRSRGTMATGSATPRNDATRLATANLPESGRRYLPPNSLPWLDA